MICSIRDFALLDIDVYSLRKLTYDLNHSEEGLGNIQQGVRLIARDTRFGYDDGKFKS